MNDEYAWVYLMFALKEKGINTKWKLTHSLSGSERLPSTMGYLFRGTRRNRGWFVVGHDDQTKATLEPTMTQADAKDAAKLILLSLKEIRS